MVATVSSGDQMSQSPDNLAGRFKALHQPGQPLLVTNIWDPATARLAVQNKRTKAIATASYAVAEVNGYEDDLMPLYVNMEACKRIAAVVNGAVPLSVDLQEGYGDQLEEAVEACIDLGAVGINLEDALAKADGASTLRDTKEQCQRIQKVKEIATRRGVPNFFINARTDALVQGHSIEETIHRGKAFLEAGGDCVFVWGGSKRNGLSREEVAQLSKAFNGNLSVQLAYEKPSALSAKEIADLNVCRMSIGPRLWRDAMRTVEQKMEALLSSQ